MAKSSRGPGSGRRRAADQREEASAPTGGDVNPASPSGQAMHSAGAGPGNAPRFRIFIVDCGWNSPARRVLLDNFSLIRELQQDDPIYVLSREKSIELARRYGSRIGRDPILAVHDMAALEGWNGWFSRVSPVTRPPAYAAPGAARVAVFRPLFGDASPFAGSRGGHPGQPSPGGADGCDRHHDAP